MDVNEEVEVINSIYDGAVEFHVDTSTVDLTVPDTTVQIKLWIPLQYPESPPKTSTVSGIASSIDNASARIQVLIDRTFVPGEVYLFTFIDEVRPIVDELLAESAKVESARNEAEQARLASQDTKIIDWATADEIKDRGSVFIGRAISAVTVDQVQELLDDLLGDKRLYGATHNMVAWRLKSEKGEITQSSDNDGESGAGNVMLHLLEASDARNVVCVVTRFYGGTHLGPDRFKHIKTAARNALVKGGFV